MLEFPGAAARSLLERASAFLEKHAYMTTLLLETTTGVLLYTVCVVFVLAAERAYQRGAEPFHTRHTVNDLLYMVLYRTGIFALLAGPLYAILISRLRIFQIDLVRPLPPVLRMVVAFVVLDFLRYWGHRLLHTSKFLWAFHSVHHAPDQLTLLTANRIHPGEQLLMGLMLFVPGLICGIPAPLWLPVTFLQTLSETMQHARLPWTFGPLKRAFVSPAFHAVHHSVDERNYDRNFGGVLSLWDALFGTFAEPNTNVKQFGVEGMYLPERLSMQLVHPFRMIFGGKREELPLQQLAPGPNT